MTEPFISLDEFPLDRREKFERIIHEAGRALVGFDHDPQHLIWGITDPVIRDALLVWVLSDENEAATASALEGRPGITLATSVLFEALRGQTKPKGLTYDAIHYLRDIFQYMPAAFSASPQAKAELFAVGAVLAFVTNDIPTRDACIANSLDFADNRLADLVLVTVQNGIVPEWVVAEAR